MFITMKSRLTGVIRTLDIGVTPESYARWKAWGEQVRQPIEIAFPELSVEERAFLQYGTTREEWENRVIEEQQKQK